MGKRSNNKNRGGNRSNNTPSSVPVEAKTSSNSTIGEEDALLLETAKSAYKDMELDLNEFRKLLEDDIQAVIDERKASLVDEIEKEKEEKRKKYEKEIKDLHSDLEKENSELRKKNAELQKENSTLSVDNDKIEKKQKKIIDEATSEAEKIIDNAIKEAEKKNQVLLEEIKKQKDKLVELTEAAEDHELEIETREKLLNSKEKRINKQAEVYETANPEAVNSLERQLAVNASQLEAVRAEYEKVQIEYNKVKILQIKTEGISPQELQETNEKLLERVEELENKCNRYSEYDLMEMKRALDKEKEYLATINNQNREITERKTEVQRLNNSILEYEQLKSQLDLLRTLNEHLRSELDNTKKMLESSVGEICPALTVIDIQQNEESGEEYERYLDRQYKKAEQKEISLTQLIDHVKLFAASQDNPLHYTDRDLRAFVAGMAASPIAILQGMSGTGKTSLPKIFIKAIMGEINIVPVESSWRDRNELLGYYNDFSKKFTAKEFTCDLYRAGCERYRETPYFIVLDEMNLSRVEYYFADFLSVLEDEKSNWKVKLVDTDLRQLPTEITKEVLDALKKEDKEEVKELALLVDKLYPDMKLTDDEEVQVSANDKMRLIAFLSGRKFKNATKTKFLVGGPQHLLNGNSVQIPRNVWFIGTANRDESTFEITDKVYDRAQVLNFNNRAAGVKYNMDVEAIYVTYDELQKLFTKAKNDSKYFFSAAENTLLKEIEQILKTNFRISFGNRIQDQMDIFVPVYVAAGRKPRMKEDEVKQLENEAIDYQLTNKVLRRLEYVEMSNASNKDAAEKLRKIFENNNLIFAKEFIDWKLRGEE